MATRPTKTTPVDDGGRIETAQLVYTVEEAATVLRIGRTMAFELIRQGQLGSLKIGHRRLVSRDDLLAFINERRAA